MVSEFAILYDLAVLYYLFTSVKRAENGQEKERERERKQLRNHVRNGRGGKKTVMRSDEQADLARVV